MAARFGRPLLVAHVVHETAETAGMYRRYHKTRDTTPMYDIARAMLEERVAAFGKDNDDLDRVPEVRLLVVPGLPENRIPELAERHDVGMIVMCSQHRRGLRHWLYGSVTERVARRATCPVVIVADDVGPPAPVTATPGALVREAPAAHEL
jgi:nucleotide-binding universal stress UspA family protein